MPTYSKIIHPQTGTLRILEYLESEYSPYLSQQLDLYKEEAGFQLPDPTPKLWTNAAPSPGAEYPYLYLRGPQMAPDIPYTIKQLGQSSLSLGDTLYRLDFIIEIGSRSIERREGLTADQTLDHQNKTFTWAITNLIISQDFANFTEYKKIGNLSIEFGQAPTIEVPPNPPQPFTAVSIIQFSIWVR